MTSILGIATMYYPEGGGGELATHLHYKALVEHGWKVSVVAYTFDSKHYIHETIDGVSVHKIRSPFPRDLIHLGVATRIDAPMMDIVRKLLLKSDVVHIAEQVYSAVPYIKSLAEKPILVHVHDHSPLCYCSGQYHYAKRRMCTQCSISDLVSCVAERRIIKLAYEFNISRVAQMFTLPVEIPIATHVSRRRKENLMQADAVVAVSNSMAEQLRCLMRGFTGKLHTVYNPLPNVEKHLRPNDEEQRTLLYAGGSLYEKGIFQLLDIWRFLVKRHEDLKLYVVGGLDSRMTRYLVGKYKITPSVRLLPRISHREMMNLLLHVNAAIVPSLGSEGLPYAVIEPMALGRAVFASPVGGIPEILKNGYGGYYIDPLDTQGSVNALERIADREEMMKQGEYAMKHIRQQLTYGRTTNRLASIIDEAIWQKA